MFCRTKFGANNVAEFLTKNGIQAMALHGNKSQAARTQALSGFKSGDIRALVATDIAARGIHVDDVTLVVHADPPVEHKAYLHRSGRTARAGASGTVHWTGEIGTTYDIGAEIGLIVSSETSKG